MLISEGNICSSLLATVTAASIFSRPGCYLKLTFSCVGTFVSPGAIAKDFSPVVLFIWATHSPYHFFLPQPIRVWPFTYNFFVLSLFGPLSNPLKQDLKEFYSSSISPLSTSSSSNTLIHLQPSCAQEIQAYPHIVTSSLAIQVDSDISPWYPPSLLLQSRGHMSPFPEV